MVRDMVEVATAVPSGGAANVVLHTFRPETSGTIVRIVAVIANFTNAVTAGLRITDANGIVIWENTSIPKNATSSIALDIDVFPTDIIRLTTSGDIGSGENVCKVKIYIRR